MQAQENDINNILLVLFCITFLIIGALVFLFIVFNNRKNQLIQDKLTKALEHQKKVHELQLNALRGQMNPHFIHNSLNAIQYYIQRNDVETSEKYLSKFSKLMRLFFDYSRKQYISIQDEIKLLENYLQIEKLRFEEQLEYTICIDSRLDTEDEYIPSMLLQPIVENAINHGIFHSKRIGKVRIEFIAIKEHHFKVIITDNGIGINKGLEMTKTLSRNRKPHSSLVLEERLSLLKDSSNFDINFSITDLSSRNLNGTEVSLVFNQSFHTTNNASISKK